MEDGRRTVWAFVGEGGRWPSAIFSSRSRAEEWISARSLTGLLTEYPLDAPIYDSAVDNGYFRPSRPEHSAADFIGRFTSAHQAHEHYENGAPG
ncbi:DUF7710 domain-containing protein [Sphaerisporangium perillae]|uniref:DUF7710 domain-containing protein n=1 Tax=Sphaerisporangium perillae TaxID=2935860 RepID=UPI00200BFDC7|nr:hypothetical protein [Sphaerisporangium perillae]